MPDLEPFDRGWLLEESGVSSTARFWAPWELLTTVYQDCILCRIQRQRESGKFSSIQENIEQKVTEATKGEEPAECGGQEKYRNQMSDW